jgi:hypothetical protein
LTSAAAGAHLRFTRERKVFAAFTGLRETTVRDPCTLSRPLVERYCSRQWEHEWAAVIASSRTSGLWPGPVARPPT